MSATAIWVPAVTAILSSASALAGVIIANRLSDKTKRQEIEEARRTAADERRRASGESLYRIIHNITNIQSASVQATWRFIRGEMKIEPYKEHLVDSNSALRQLDKAGMHLAIATHFADLEQERAAFDDAITRCMKFNDDLVRHLRDKDIDKAVLESAYGSLEEDLKKAGFGLCSKIAKKLSG